MLSQSVNQSISESVSGFPTAFSKCHQVAFNCLRKWNPKNIPVSSFISFFWKLPPCLVFVSHEVYLFAVISSRGAIERPWVPRWCWCRCAAAAESQDAGLALGCKPQEGSGVIVGHSDCGLPIRKKVIRMCGCVPSEAPPFLHLQVGETSVQVGCDNHNQDSGLAFLGFLDISGEEQDISYNMKQGSFFFFFESRLF